MNQKKNIFGLLGGIFLMSAGFCSFLITAVGLIRSLRYSVNFNSILGACVAVLILLCGLFLLLRKPLVAAIMMSAAAFFYILNISLTAIIYTARYDWVSVVCIFLAYALFAAGLFGRGVYALVMCLAAATIRFFPLVSQLTAFPRSVSYGGLSVFNSSLSLLSSLLILAGMIMAGLCLFRKEKAAPAPARPEYPY
ncbi:MAG: hypothetical protein IJQ43_07210 [Oscillospiraceae bacterium]|nr:hypothetical protein [Oscillospiraceae bacterium]